MNNYKKSEVRKKALFLLFIFVFILIILLLFYILNFCEKEAVITSKQFDKNYVLANYDNFTNEGNYALYRQGNPEHIYMAENSELPFSEIETYTSSISLDKSLKNVENIKDIIVGYFPESDYKIFYSKKEIAIIRKDDDFELVTLYFTNKTGSPSYPDYGNATFSKCENISIIIFKLNENLYCSAVGRNISDSDLLEIIQSLSS